MQLLGMTLGKPLQFENSALGGGDCSLHLVAEGYRESLITFVSG